MWLHRPAHPFQHPYLVSDRLAQILRSVTFRGVVHKQRQSPRYSRLMVVHRSMLWPHQPSLPFQYRYLALYCLVQILRSVMFKGAVHKQRQSPQSSRLMEAPRTILWLHRPRHLFQHPCPVLEFLAWSHRSAMCLEAEQQQRLSLQSFLQMEACHIMWWLLLRLLLLDRHCRLQGCLLPLVRSALCQEVDLCSLLSQQSFQQMEVRPIMLWLPLVSRHFSHQQQDCQHPSASSASCLEVGICGPLSQQSSQQMAVHLIMSWLPQLLHHFSQQ